MEILLMLLCIAMIPIILQVIGYALIALGAFLVVGHGISLVHGLITRKGRCSNE